MPQRSSSLKQLVIFALCACVLIGSVVEFEAIAWGTGIWLGQFALSWALALLLFGLLAILCLAGMYLVLWSPRKLEGACHWLVSFRERLGPLRWLLALLFLLLPVYILQYTFWGIVLHGPYLRIFLALLASLLLGWMLTRDRERLLTWPAGLAALVLSAGTYTIFVALVDVTSYPFSLGWSEGNRLWDYSMLFGRHLYNYPADKPVYVLLDIGRQFIGGLPFLIPGLTIWQARLWVALVDVVPYLLLGWAAFRLTKKDLWRWLLAGLWAFTFVHQGPIHPPLLLAAIVVALAWERPLWLAVPLILIASYFAEVSRFTWMFAPGLWAAMLELCGPALRSLPSDKKAWARSISVGLSGAFGGYAAPFLVPGLIQWVRSLGPASNATSAAVIPALDTAITGGRINASISSQPLLWSRLLPNATYGEGIVIGLSLAIVPLILVLVYLVRTDRWKLDLWQRLAILLPLLAFLGVGLIVSVKIGGGGDLHNMDMLIIGLMFAGALAWRSGASRWIAEIHASPAWLQLVMLALIVIPGYRSLRLMAPLSITEDRKLVATLADIDEDPLPNPLPDTLPANADTLKALATVQKRVARASQSGEVLFMDQRQLLTFGYLQNIPLVPEYDKKVLINRALSGDAHYFEGFYRDLAAGRFSLIVTNPVNRRLDKSDGNFAEENNAWVKWVTTPLLCYYESSDRLKRVDIELLVPRQDISACDETLPTHTGE